MLRLEERTEHRESLVKIPHRRNRKMKKMKQIGDQCLELALSVWWEKENGERDHDGDGDGDDGGGGGVDEQ